MKLVLSNGAVLDNLTLNGDEFTAEYAISPTTFQYNLAIVSVYENSEDETPAQVLRDAKLVYCRAITENLTRFALIESSSLERSMYDLRADIDYIAMLTGITLEVD